MPSRRRSADRDVDRAQFTGLAWGLRERRMMKLWSQLRVAEEIGVTPRMLQDWEYGRVVPGSVYFIRWLNALGLTMELVEVADAGGAGQ